MKKLYLRFTICAYFLISASSHAAYIVDTGPVVNEVTNITVNSWTQFFAVEFTLDQSYDITGIDAWAKNTDDSSDGILVRIYPDAGETPSGRSLYDSGVVIHQVLDWYHAPIIDLTLDAGSYWVAFEMSGGGGSAFFPIGSANPQVNAARKNVGFNWIEDDAFAAMGLRIEGAAVPIPPALYLFGSGLLGLAGITRRKNKCV